jgi:hypothetical protein
MRSTANPDHMKTGTHSSERQRRWHIAEVPVAHPQRVCDCEFLPIHGAPEPLNHSCPFVNFP